MIARVFPRKTNASPMDGMAFFREPTIENISDCIEAGVRMFGNRETVSPRGLALSLPMFDAILRTFRLKIIRLPL